MRQIHRSTYQCPCHDFVTGRTCTACQTNFYDLAIAHETGCKPCACNPDNSKDPSAQCNLITGECDCIDGLGSRDCSTCENGFWGDDCKPCNCNSQGIKSGAEICDPFNGQCNCIEGVTGQLCDECATGWEAKFLTVISAENALRIGMHQLLFLLKKHIKYSTKSALLE